MDVSGIRGLWCVVWEFSIQKALYSFPSKCSIAIRQSQNRFYSLKVQLKPIIEKVFIVGYQTIKEVQKPRIFNIAATLKNVIYKRFRHTPENDIDK
jgi:hypothetical protein